MVKHLKIGWRNYTVIEKEPDSDLVTGGNHCYGTIWHDDRNIFINSRYDDTQKIATLIHEAIHGIDDASSIGLEEEQVLVLANGFATLIADNPKLLEEFEILCKSSSE